MTRATQEAAKTIEGENARGTSLAEETPGSDGLNEICRALIAALMGLLVLAGSLIMAPPARGEPDVRQEVECLALTIYFEARGEPDTGKLAVGHVVMNRASHPLFPGAVCAVVRQGGERLRYRCQFSWWCDGQSDHPTEWRAWQRSKALARRIYWDYSEDPTAGALWYHADYVTPSWRNSLAPGPKIGRHIFYRDSGKI